MRSERRIRSRAMPHCRFCGATGEVLHRNLVDRLFGAAGLWTLKRCANAACGLIWLDPMPMEEDIGLAYENYHTHEASEDKRAAEPLSLTERLLLGIRWTAYGIFGIDGEKRRRQAMYLDKVPPGRLLDVGCGNGEFLARMTRRGWQVEGQEIDAEAAAGARARHGLTIHLGPLPELNLPDASFDAIVMNHVIEHLPDPERSLAECRRLLRPGGQLVLVTPNVGSLCHRLFGRIWRGLEPPRHLHLFSCQTLRVLAERCNFQAPEVWTVATGAGWMAIASLAGRKLAPEPIGPTGNSPALWILAGCVQLVASTIHFFARNSGEECVLRAIR